MFLYLFFISFIAVVCAFIACAYLQFSIVSLVALAISVIVSFTIWKLTTLDGIVQNNQKESIKSIKQLKKEITELKEQIEELKKNQKDE